MSIPTPASMPQRRPYDQVISETLADVEDTQDLPLPEVIERLTAASEVLSRVLETSADNVQGSLPSLRRP